MFALVCIDINSIIKFFLAVFLIVSIDIIIDWLIIRFFFDKFIVYH